MFRFDFFKPIKTIFVFYGRAHRAHGVLAGPRSAVAGAAVH
jgi:hypothetical protein